MLFALALAATVADGGTAAPGQPDDAGARATDAGARATDAGARATDAGARATDAGSTDAGLDASGNRTAANVPPLPLPAVREVPQPPPNIGPLSGPAPKISKIKHGKAQRGTFPDVILEAQNHLQSIARRYVQLLMSRRFDEARLLHDEEGGRRPDWTGIRTAASTFLDTHGPPRSIDQSLTTYSGAELFTFYFTALFADNSELPMRVAVDHRGHVSGAGVGGEVVPAAKKRYDRFDLYKPRTVLSLPFLGTWMASNATLAPGNGHYLNANQRFAVDFFIVEETEAGKRKSHRDSGKQNIDYFAYGRDIVAPADALVVQVIDGVPDNPPGQTDVYYRLGNSIVLSFENGEYAHLCHLLPGSMRVRPGDRVLRGQLLAKCGNSGNSTGPHLHFQLTDGPQISHATSLPAYFRNVRKNGIKVDEALPQSGDRLENVRISASASAP